MSTKEQVYVVIKDEETRKKALQVLIKHDQNSEYFKDFKERPFLKFVPDQNIWLTSDYPYDGTTEISVERLDEILSQSKSEKENGWYKHTSGNHKLWLVYYNFKDNVRYGFDANGDWFNDNFTDYRSCLELASQTEVKERLTEEAIKRGLVYSSKILSLITKEKITLTAKYYNFAPYPEYFNLGERHILAQGQWAEVPKAAHEFKELTKEEIDAGRSSAYEYLDFQNESPRPVEKSILQEAEEIINGSRAEDYGSVTENFTKIAVGWKEIFADGNFTPRRVALAMAWLKICRDVNTPKRDNLVDGIGYFGCVEKMDNEAN